MANSVVIISKSYIVGFLRFVITVVDLIFKDSSVSIIKTILFNFHFLPYEQAVLLPIWLYSPHILEQDGEVNIINSHIYSGMIKLGKSCIALYPRKSITLAFIKGSKTIFHGNCFIGNCSTIRVIGRLEFGNDFCATYRMSLLCMDRIFLEYSNTFAWDILIMDCSQHMLKDVNSGKNGRYTKRNIVW